MGGKKGERREEELQQTKQAQQKKVKATNEVAVLYVLEYAVCVSRYVGVTPPGGNVADRAVKLSRTHGLCGETGPPIAMTVFDPPPTVRRDNRPPPPAPQTFTTHQSQNPETRERQQ